MFVRKVNNPLQPCGNYMYRQFNIQQFYVLPTQRIYVLCGSENKQRLFPYTALTDWFFITETECVYCGVRNEALTRLRFALEGLRTLSASQTA